MSTTDPSALLDDLTNAVRQWVISERYLTALAAVNVPPQCDGARDARLKRARETADSRMTIYLDARDRLRDALDEMREPIR